MFHRVTVEEWHQITPILSFGITFLVFIVAVVRAMLTRRERCRQLASLPLDEKHESGRPQA
jgi:hypothetical protein